MTRQEFNGLEEMEKLSVILRSGRLLAQHKEDGMRIFLYGIDNFYTSANYLPNDELKEIYIYDDINQLPPAFHRQVLSVHPAARAYKTPEI